MKRLLCILLFIFSSSGCVINRNYSESAESIMNSGYTFVEMGDYTYWKPLHEVAPHYPKYGYKRRSQGCVAVIFTIDESGKPKRKAILKSFPKSIFDKSAISALEKTTYEPTLKNKKREPIITTTIFTYFLDYGRSKKKLEELRLRMENKCKNNV